MLTLKSLKIVTNCIDITHDSTKTFYLLLSLDFIVLTFGYDYFPRTVYLLIM